MGRNMYEHTLTLLACIYRRLTQKNGLSQIQIWCQSKDDRRSQRPSNSICRVWPLSRCSHRDALWCSRSNGNSALLLSRTRERFCRHAQRPRRLPTGNQDVCKEVQSLQPRQVIQRPLLGLHQLCRIQLTRRVGF